MKLVQILKESKNISEFKKQLTNLKDYNLTISEMKKIDREINEKKFTREKILNLYIALGNWYCSFNSPEMWKEIKSNLLRDNEISSTTKDYLAILG